MGWLTGELVRSLTPWSLLLIIILIIALGGLLPRWIVVRLLKDKDDQIKDWREACRLSESAREKSEQALREALEVARAAEDALKGFRAATVQLARERGGPG